jgi:hypothetical protein
VSKGCAGSSARSARPRAAEIRVKDIVPRTEKAFVLPNGFAVRRARDYSACQERTTGYFSDRKALAQTTRVAKTMVSRSLTQKHWRVFGQGVHY